MARQIASLWPFSGASVAPQRVSTANMMMRLSLVDLHFHPALERWVVDRQGRHCLIRPLRPQDGPALTQLLTGLSPASRSQFGPHPLDAATAHHLCQHRQPERWMHLVMLAPDGQMLAYLVLRMYLEWYEVERFAGYSLDLAEVPVASLAPVVAEGHQEQGHGSQMLRYGIELCRALDYQAILLMGGVQMANQRAVRFYLKGGFRRLGGFEYPAGQRNDDMIRWL